MNRDEEITNIFRYVAIDGYGAETEVRIRIVNGDPPPPPPPNYRPVARADSYTVEAGQRLVVPAKGPLANDTDEFPELLRITSFTTRRRWADRSP